MTQAVYGRLQSVKVEQARPTEKSELRRWAQERRTALPLSSLSEILVHRICELPEWEAAGHVMIYLAMPKEISIETILTQQTSKRWYIPRCAPSRRLAIHPYEPEVTPLRTGPFGIQEPDPIQVPEVDPTILDAVIVPALLLTPQGERLGYGGGYYDRFLPRLRLDCLRIGAIPEELLVETIPQDPWDMVLDIVVTPSRTFHRDP
jgi:5-formyltetrahydrofolate cyclo-ligase